MISHFIRSFPKLTSHYTEYRISEYAGRCIRAQNFRKNYILQFENMKKKTSEDIIYMIVEGKVHIFKTMHYID